MMLSRSIDEILEERRLERERTRRKGIEMLCADPEQRVRKQGELLLRKAHLEGEEELIADLETTLAERRRQVEDGLEQVRLHLEICDAAAQEATS